MVVLLAWGDDLFAVIFGEEWREAGVYAQILSPMAAIRLISAPLSYVYILREKLVLNMILQGLLLTLTVMSILVGGFLDDIKLMLFLMSASGVLFYCLQLCFSFRLTKIASTF